MKILWITSGILEMNINYTRTESWMSYAAMVRPHIRNQFDEFISHLYKRFLFISFAILMQCLRFLNPQNAIYSNMSIFHCCCICVSSFYSLQAVCFLRLFIYVRLNDLVDAIDFSAKYCTHARSSNNYMSSHIIQA